MRSLLDSRTPGFRYLCWLLVCIVTWSPGMTALAQRAEVSDPTLLADPAVAPESLGYMLPQSCATLSLRPKQLLESKLLQMYPVEVLQAASIQYTGIDPFQCESILASVEPPMAGPPNYSVVAHFSPGYQPVLNAELTQHTQPSELAGRRFLKSQQPFLPSFFTTERGLLLAAPEMTIKKFVDAGAAPASTLLMKKLAQSTGDDLYLGVDLQPLRPLVNQLLMQEKIPDQLQFLYALPDLIRLVELRINISGNGRLTELIVEANNEFDATKILSILEQTMQMWVDQALTAAEQMLNSDDPIEQAMGRYIERISKQSQSELMPQQDGARLVLFSTDLGANESSTFTFAATSGILVALLLPAVQAARTAARRNQSMNSLKQLMLSLLNFESAYGRFPAYANFSQDGKPLLSWRVHILPFLEQQALYDQFHLDEPWDSPHNKQLVRQMPAVFLDPASSKYTREMGHTHFLGVKGETAVFAPSPPGNKLQTVTDGTSNTLMLLQVNDQRATIWTKPDDWELDEQNPLSGLVPGPYPGVFNVARADGSVHSISNDVDLKTFKAMLTRNGGEVVP